MRASVVYWFAGDRLRSDGGGMRVLAWQTALVDLGYETQILPLRVLGGNGRGGSVLSKAKRAVFPMPFEQQLPDVGSSDLVVATVPGVFRSAVRRVPKDRLLFDWMDRWSSSARSMKATSIVSRPGSALQAATWARREHRLPGMARGNAYAGYDDFERMRSADGSAHQWLPNPLPFVGGDTSRVPSRPKRVGFIGSLDYPPNEASLRQFFARYSQRLAEEGIEVVVAGFGSDRVRGWDVGATVIGEVSSPSVLYGRVDAAIVPIDHGGGIKIKAIEALSYGLPVFATEHVRLGFSPAFRDSILDLDALFDRQVAPPGPLARTEFDSAFSQDAFTVVVERLLHG